jgi:hypothetical protein
LQPHTLEAEQGLPVQVEPQEPEALAVVAMDHRMQREEHLLQVEAPELSTPEVVAAAGALQGEVERVLAVGPG